MERFLTFLRANKWTIVLVAAGLVLTILLFAIGFWRTILLLAIVSVCFLMGYLLDRGGWSAVKRFFSTLFSRDQSA